MKSKLAIFFITALALSVGSFPAIAATYYVTPSGSDSNGCTNASTDACASPGFAASKLTSSGDILEIQAATPGGSATYNVSGSMIYNNATIRPRATNCTIRARAGDAITLNGGSSPPTGTVIGAVSQSGTVIYGLTIKGVVLFWYSSNCRIENCDISVGSDGDYNNTRFDNLVFVEGSDGLIVRNNRLHDNPYYHAAAKVNRSQIIIYDTDNMLVEFNDFLNSGGGGIYLKSNPINNAAIKRNFFFNLASFGVAGIGQNSGSGTQSVYENVFWNCNTSNDDDYGAGGYNHFGCQTTNVFNNTVVNPAYQSSFGTNAWCGGGAINFWNNVSVNSANYHWRIGYNGGLAQLSYLNHNAYSPSGSFYSSGIKNFSEWKSILSANGTVGAEANSVTPSAVGFFNPTGSASSDYRLTSASPSDLKTGGRGGSYTSYMGAWDPNSAGMWVGYCSAGVGGCNVSGLGGGGGDTTPPSVSITTSDPQTITADSLSVAWTDSDNIGVVTRKWRIGDYPTASTGTAATSPATTSGYSSGQNTLYVGVADAAGNWAYDTIVVTYNPSGVFTLTNPTPSGTIVCAQDPLPVSLGVTSSAAVTARIATTDLDYDDMTDVFAVTGGTSHSETKNLPCGQTYTYYARAEDGGGNESASSTVISFTIAAAAAGPLATEPFENAAFASRGWFDSSGGTILAGGGYSGNAFECAFASGGTECSGGSPKRVSIAATETLYIRFYVKFDAGWQWPGTSPYPYLLWVLSDQDDPYVGPGDPWQAVQIGAYNSQPWIGASDGKAIDEANIGVDLCSTTESRAVHGCNGICDGNTWTDVICADAGGGSGGYYNARRRHAASPGLATGVWHKFEGWFAMNSISDGEAVSDGQMKLWLNGSLVVSQSEIQFRTGIRPTQKFATLLFNPYIGGAGSPAAQKFWFDDLTILSAIPEGGSQVNVVGGAAFKFFSGNWQ